MTGRERGTLRQQILDTVPCADSNVIESCAFGLIFALGVLSFADGAPVPRNSLESASSDWQLVEPSFSFFVKPG